MAKKPIVSDLPPLENIVDEPKEVKDIRIPGRGKGEAQAASSRPDGAPATYVYPTDMEYKKLLGVWLENKQPGTITVGSKDYQVILPDGYPVFVPIVVSLDAAYGSLSGGVSRK